MALNYFHRIEQMIGNIIKKKPKPSFLLIRHYSISFYIKNFRHPLYTYDIYQCHTISLVFMASRDILAVENLIDNTTTDW